MKKNYISPEIELVSLYVTDVLAASDYNPTPEIPTRAGKDNPIDDL